MPKSRLLTPRLAIFLIPLALAPIQGSPIERDLGVRLRYFRVHSVPEDLPSEKVAARRPCILDLRFASAADGAATAFEKWIVERAASGNPLFVLVNGFTAPALRGPLRHPNAIAGLILLGTSCPQLTPDFTVHESPVEERRAYEALEHGATVADLTTDNPEKVRDDEASLARENDTETENGDDPTTVAKRPDPKPPLIDSSLQLAIHLYQGVEALNRRS